VSTKETALVPVEYELRPRERFLRNGIGSLRDDELVALLLRTGSPGTPVARLSRRIVELIDACDGPPEDADLATVRGVGPAKAATISAAFELGRRVLAPAHHRIRTPSDVLPLVQHYDDRSRERFLVVTLNGAHEVIRSHLVTIGLVNRTVVHPREVFAPAIEDRATAIIAAHNHPSGNLDISEEDREVTRRLADAGTLLGVPLLDHVIFTASGYRSLLEEGEL
jgi:DNA repair protein RadC